MQNFPIHTIESAPEKSKPLLQGLKQNFGFIPNAAATMAESPVLIGAFVGTFVGFHGGSFTEGEKQTLLLTNAVTLRCPWTVAFHSTAALGAGVSQSDVAAIRNGQLPSDATYAALSAVTKALIEKRGNVAEGDIDRFFSAGYSQTQLLEVIAGIAISTMAATTANLADTPVEDRFKPQTWVAA